MFDGLHTCLGIELKIIDHNNFSCRYSILSKKGNLLTILSSKKVDGALTTIFDALPKKYPVALVLNSKGILHKNIQLPDGATPEVKFSMAFPGVEQKEFYSQEFNEGENGIINIVRLQFVDDLLAKFDQAGLKIYTLSLGAIITAHIWSQLNAYGQRIQFDGHVFSLTDDQQFVAYRYDSNVKGEFPIKIAEEILPEENVVSYAAAFQLLLYQKLSTIVANVNSVNLRLIRYIENEKIRRKAFLFLFGLFGVLLINFLVFSFYNQENLELVKKVGMLTATVDQTDLMKKNIAENEALLKQLNWNGGYNYGFLLNELGLSLPKRLKLQEVVMNEFKTEQEKLERLPTIKIIGTTDNLSAVNNWIFVLKEKPWIKEVKLLKYQEDPETDDYQFNIVLMY